MALSNVQFRMRQSVMACRQSWSSQERAPLFLLAMTSLMKTDFAALGPRDVAIRVGGGATIAQHRLANPEEVANALWQIHDARVDLASR